MVKLNGYTLELVPDFVRTAEIETAAKEELKKRGEI